MKKILITLMALLMALATLTVFADDAVSSPEADDLTTVADLTGFVLEIHEDRLLVKTPDGLYVEALLTPSTLFEGKDVMVGDFVHIAYNGMMTRSLPAQITAEVISCYMVQGLVSELAEGSFTLTFGEDVYHVNASEAGIEGLQDGMFATVYHSGLMTMSLPPQIVAEHIRGHEIVGVVTEMIENGFTLTVEGEELPYTVFPREDALLFVQPEPGMEIIVVTDGLMTSALDSITVNAMEILPLPTAQELYDLAGVVTEITPEFILMQTVDGQTVQVNLFAETLLEGKEIAVGDFIHVTYNGQMTFSIPAQVAALKVGCYVHTGVVSDLSETLFVLNTELEPIVVNAPAELLDGLTDGAVVTVYSNGAMTMSLPAQIGAEMITVTETIVD